MHLLGTFAEAARPLTPIGLNGQLNWPKQTIHRLWQPMIENSLIERQNERLQLTPRTMETAASLNHLTVNRTICHQILLRIAREVGETINFVRPETLGMIYVDRVETNRPLHIMLPLGKHVPFHCAASGKTFLASLPKFRCKQVIESMNLEAQTSQTHTTADVLEAELKSDSQESLPL